MINVILTVVNNNLQYTCFIYLQLYLQLYSLQLYCSESRKTDMWINRNHKLIFKSVKEQKQTTNSN